MINNHQNIKSSLIKGVAWTSVSVWVVRAVGIIYTLVTLSYLSVYEYGLTELVLTIPGLLSFFCLPGLETAVVADMSGENAKSDTQKAKFIFTSYISIRLLLGFIVWAILFLSAPLVELHYNSTIATMVQILSFAFLLNPIRAAYQILFRVHLKFHLLAAHRVVEEVVKLSVVSVSFFVFDLGPLGVIIAFISTDVAALPIFAPVFVKQWKSSFAEVRGESGWLRPWHNLKYHGKWGIFSSYVNSFGQNVRPWIIQLALGTHAVGIYAAAVGMYQNTASLIPINQVAAPVVPQFVNKPKALQSLANAVLRYQLVAYLLAGLAMLLFLPTLIKLLFPEFSNSYVLYVVLLVALVPSAFVGIYETIFIALKAQKDLFVANIAILCSVVIVLPISIYFFGILGVAFEFAFTRTLYALGRYLKLREIYPSYTFNPRSIFSISEYDKLLLRKLVVLIKPNPQSVKKE